MTPLSSEGEPANDAAFVDAAIREGMLAPMNPARLKKQVAASGKTAAEHLVDTGRLKPIQAEAIDGLLRSDSVAPGYEVVGLLGHGGIGVVYRARQPSLDREVALKTISTARVREAGGSGSVAVARFQQEAKAIAKLQHPGIVAAYDYGAGEDRMYLAMELVPGVDLESFIKQHDRVDEPTAWRLVRQAAAALAHAHDAGVIHRDIKPANLLLTEPPAGYPLPAGVPLLKVTDFGLARLQPGPAGDGSSSQGAAREEATRLTVMGATMGTPHYMAPEQIDSAQVDLRADVYALGATAYHMIAGEPPLAGLSLMKIFAAKLSGEGATVDDLPPDVSDGARSLLRDMLRHDPSDRPGGYAELLERIDRLLGDESALAAKPVTLSTTLAVPAPQPAPAAEVSATVDLASTTRPRASKRRVAWALVAVAALAGPAAVGLLSSPGGPPTPRYAASNRLEDERLLYTGDALGWNRIVINKSPSEERDFPAMLKVEGDAARTIRGDRATLPDADHFRFSFQVGFGAGAEALEIVLETNEQYDERVVRIEPSAVVFGVRDRRGERFIPLTDAAEPPRTTGAFQAIDGEFPTFALDRDERHWFLYQYDDRPEPRRLAWAAIDGPAPDEFRFRAVGGDVFLGGEPILIGLLPIDEP